jgi:predicted PurR-regulated permease PerM
MKNVKFIKIFILAAAILLTVKIMFDFKSIAAIFANIMSVLNPFLFGFIIAYCINIPVYWLEKKLKKLGNKLGLPKDGNSKNNKQSKKEDIPGKTDKSDKPHLLTKAARPISIVVNLILLAAIIVFGLMNIIPMIYQNASQLIEALPGYIDSGINELEQLPIVTELGIDDWLGNLNITDLMKSFQTPNPIDVATGFFSGLVTAFLTIVATLYFLIEYNSVKEFIKRLIRAHSPKRQRPALKYIHLVDTSFRKYISCQSIDALILGTITMVQFTVMGSQYAVTLGLMLGVTNMVPYFGAIVGALVAVFIIWATEGIGPAIIAAVMLLITQQIDGNFILPKLMGTSFKISPVLIIIAITIGGAIGGIIGVIFSIPIVNVLKTILEEYIRVKEQRKINRKQSEVQTGETINDYI